MLVTVLVKIGVPGNITVGKISEVLPVWSAIKYGKKTLDSFIPVVMELKIPCNDSKSDLFLCGPCQWNDWELCDRIKYLRNEWTPGDVDNPPKAFRGRYQIDYSAFISESSLAEYGKEEKTETKMNFLMLQAENNQKTDAAIIDLMGK